jgi:hypothetical protein
MARETSVGPAISAGMSASSANRMGFPIHPREEVTIILSELGWVDQPMPPTTDAAGDDVSASPALRKAPHKVWPPA